MIRRRNRARIRRPTLDALRVALTDVRPRGERPLVDLLRRELAVGADALDRSSPAGVLEALEELGLIEGTDGLTRPLARLDPVDGLLVASDLRRRHDEPDFVAGPAPASLLLARHVPGQAGGRLLDLGCGSGIQGLVRADRRTHVTAIDINSRAVAFTRFNAALNDRQRLRAELGDFLGPEPDRRLDGRFDAVVANPPFVLAPAWRLGYRDRPLPHDEVGARTVERVARALAPGGRGYVLCNWIDRGGSWSDPVRTWTASLGRNVVVTRLRTLDPAGYAVIWTRTEPAATRPEAARAWTAALRAEGVESIHVGVIAITRARRDAPMGATSFDAQVAAVSRPRAGATAGTR